MNRRPVGPLLPAEGTDGVEVRAGTGSLPGHDACPSHKPDASRRDLDSDVRSGKLPASPSSASAAISSPSRRTSVADSVAHADRPAGSRRARRPRDGVPVHMHSRTRAHQRVTAQPFDSTSRSRAEGVRRSRRRRSSSSGRMGGRLRRRNVVPRLACLSVFVGIE